VQLALTEPAVELIDQAVQIVAGLHDDLLAPLGGRRSKATKSLVEDLRALVAHQPEGAPR
jgi:hypothetical protein